MDVVGQDSCSGGGDPAGIVKSVERSNWIQAMLTQVRYLLETYLRLNIEICSPNLAALGNRMLFIKLVMHIINRALSTMLSLVPAAGRFLRTVTVTIWMLDARTDVSLFCLPLLSHIIVPL